MAGTVRPKHIDNLINLYEYLDANKDPEDGRTRLFSYQIGQAINITQNKVSDLMSELVALECIKLIKRSSGSYYPSTYELIKAPTRDALLKYRERTGSPDGFRVKPTLGQRNEFTIAQLRKEVENLKKVTISLIERLDKLENK